MGRALSPGSEDGQYLMPVPVRLLARACACAIFPAVSVCFSPV